MRLPNDLKPIPDDEIPGDLRAIRIGLVGGLIAVGIIAAPRLFAWWLVFASGVLDAIASLVSSY